MALFGSDWGDTSSEDIGPLSHWKEETFFEPISEFALCKKLRKKTGMGLMDCRKCLVDYDWNFEEAFKHYRSYAWDGRL